MKSSSGGLNTADHSRAANTAQQMKSSAGGLNAADHLQEANTAEQMKSSAGGPNAAEPYCSGSRQATVDGGAYEDKNCIEKSCSTTVTTTRSQLPSPAGQPPRPPHKCSRLQGCRSTSGQFRTPIVPKDGQRNFTNGQRWADIAKPSASANQYGEMRQESGRSAPARATFVDGEALNVQSTMRPSVLPHTQGL